MRRIAHWLEVPSEAQAPRLSVHPKDRKVVSPLIAAIKKIVKYQPKEKDIDPTFNL